MAVTPSFRTFVVEQLSRATANVRARAMFGGIGIYSGELFFALIDEDTVYFKVDDSNRAEFVARSMGPFQPAGPGNEVMQYYAVPEDVLEDPEALRPWIEGSLAVARRKKAGGPKRGRA